MTYTSRLFRTAFKSQAFKAGYIAGQIDRATGTLSVYLTSAYQTELQAGYNAARGLNVTI